jgi:hypothetical protein
MLAKLCWSPTVLSKSRPQSPIDPVTEALVSSKSQATSSKSTTMTETTTNATITITMMMATMKSATTTNNDDIFIQIY